MSDYIGVVPVTFDKNGTGKVYLFECKPWSTVKEGEYVMIKDAAGKADFVIAVADSRTIDKTSEEYPWLVQVMGARHPLARIVGKFTPVEYKDDDVIPFE